MLLVVLLSLSPCCTYILYFAVSLIAPDNLAANYSRELADYIIYVIDVAGGDKVPRKGGPGITQSDLLVVNKTDLAEAVGADLEVRTLLHCTTHCQSIDSFSRSACAHACVCPQERVAFAAAPSRKFSFILRAIYLPA